MMRNLFVLFLFFSISSFSQETIDTSNHLMSDQLSDVEIFSSTDKSDRSISLSRKQFLTLAGALEDPTRLLIKFPGISTVNDQANSVVYHGMPAQYHRWSLYGARILNPNHLGNAGTISDFPSRSAGGVNMFSGQVIGNLDFNGNPSGKSLDALAGSSDMKLRDPFQNTISTNLSLIGLEAGIDRISKDGKGSFLVNYRYSTVGLLTSLGLDFGGEVINYQDLTGKYSRKFSNGSSMSMYFSGGFDSNTKDPIPLGDQPEEYKDLQEIDYSSKNIVGGINYNRNRSNSSFVNTVNVSFNSTNRTSLIPTSSILQVTNSEYENNEYLVASRHDYTYKREKWNLGGTSELSFHTISMEKKYPDRSQEILIAQSLDRNSFNVLSSIHSQYKLSENFELNGRIGLQSEFANRTFFDKNVNSLVGKSEIKYTKSNVLASLRYSRTTQIFQPEILLYSISQDFVKSNNVEANLNYKGIGFSAFMHSVSNIPVSTIAYGFSAFENLDNLPIRNGVELVNLNAIGEVDVYGLAMSFARNIGGYTISSNLTLTDSKHTGPNESTKAPLDYGHVFNMSMSKNWKFGKNRQIGVSGSFHHRGGARQNHVDLERSYVWGYTNYEINNQYTLRLEDYYRVDFRIVYKPSKRSTISLDIQNVTSRENDAYYFFEPYYGTSTLKKQLPMIPILGWRVDW